MWMRLTTALVLALGGCSSGGFEPVKHSGHCVDRSGSYLYHYVETSGNCGPVSDQISVVGGATAQAVEASCKGTQLASTDNCAVELDLTCPAPTAPGVYVHSSGRADWSNDGSRGSAVIEYTLTGAVNCSSVYDETITRQ